LLVLSAPALARLLVRGVYLGGVFMAISKGLPVWVNSLVVGVQPLLMASCVF